MELENIRTATHFVQWLWESGNYFNNDKSINNIQALANTKGFTFSKQVIRMSLKRSKFITKSGKGKTKFYKQKYPHTHKKTNNTSNFDKELFDLLHIHLEIRRVSYKLFQNKHYEQSVFDSFKKLNNMVKDKSGLKEDGKSLMLSVFCEQARFKN